MTIDGRTTQVLTRWLAEQPEVAPDRLAEAVLDDLAVTPQRGRWNVVVRSLPMFSASAMRIYAVLGAIGLAGAIGFSLWNTQPSIGPAPAPTPTATVAPTPSPTPSPSSTVSPTAEQTSTLTIGDPGGYYPGFFVRASIQMPPTTSGWALFYDSDQIAGVARYGGSDVYGVSAGVTIGSGVRPYADPCAAAADLKPVAVGPSVDDLVQALSAVPVIVSPVTDTTISGYPAKTLTFDLPAPRKGCENGQFVVWQWRPFYDHQLRQANGAGQTRVWVLDVGGTRVMIQAEDYEPATQSERVQKILDSIRLSPKSIASPSAAP